MSQPTPTPKPNKSEPAAYSFIIALVAVVMIIPAMIFSAPYLAALAISLGLFAVVLAVLSLRETL